MKKLVCALAAFSALAVALPAAAQPYGDYARGYDRSHDRGYDRGYNRSYDRGYGYGYDVRGEIERLDHRIDRSRAMHRISYREAQRLKWQVSELRRLHRAYFRNDGRLSRWETRDLQNRIFQVQANLRHERRDGDGYYGRRY